MRLNHLGLPVRDTGRSRLFYETHFGFDPATAQRYPDGTVFVRNADGFDLALHEVEDPDGHRIEIYWEPVTRAPGLTG